jgi:integrase
MANKRVRLPKRNPAVLDQDKLWALFERARGTRLYPFIVTASATGCRRGELLALQWSDLNDSTGALSVSKSLEQTKVGGLRVKSTKSDVPRRFSVPEWALEVPRDHREERVEDRRLPGSDYQDNGLIFCQPDGAFHSPDREGARMAELMRKVGMEDASLHSLRHSHASSLLSGGVPVAVVFERLGHADQNLTLYILQPRHASRYQGRGEGQERCDGGRNFRGAKTYGQAHTCRYLQDRHRKQRLC